MKEKLQEYALIAEIVSAAAIVASLIFVGLQIQEGNRETRAAAYQTRISASVEAFQIRAVSESLLMAYAKLNSEGVDSLTAVEFQSVQDWEVARVLRLAGQYSSYSQGYLEEMAYTQIVAIARGLVPLWVELEIKYERYLQPEYLSQIEN